MVTFGRNKKIIIKFLIAEGVESAEIYRRLFAVFKSDTLSRSRVFEWCACFRSSRQSVSDDTCVGAPHMAITDQNISRADACILADRWVKVLEIANELSLSVGSVETIIHEHLKFFKVSARWVPKQLTNEHKQQRIDICQSRHSISSRTEWIFESYYYMQWVHHYMPESKQSSEQWKHVSSPSPKKFKLQPSAGKVMACIFWDIRGVVLVDFLPKGQTVNAAYYCALLSDRLRLAIRSYRPDLLRKGVILQHDNAPPHTAH